MVRVNDGRYSVSEKMTLAIDINSNMVYAINERSDYRTWTFRLCEESPYKRTDGGTNDNDDDDDGGSVVYTREQELRASCLKTEAPRRD